MSSVDHHQLCRPDPICNIRTEGTPPNSLSSLQATYACMCFDRRRRRKGFHDYCADKRANGRLFRGRCRRSVRTLLKSRRAWLLASNLQSNSTYFVGGLGSGLSVRQPPDRVKIGESWLSTEDVEKRQEDCVIACAGKDVYVSDRSRALRRWLVGPSATYA